MVRIAIVQIIVCVITVIINLVVVFYRSLDKLGMTGPARGHDQSGDSGSLNVEYEFIGQSFSEQPDEEVVHADTADRSQSPKGFTFDNS